MVVIAVHKQEEIITHMTMLAFHGQYYIIGKVKTEFAPTVCKVVDDINALINSFTQEACIHVRTPLAIVSLIVTKRDFVFSKTE